MGTARVLLLNWLVSRYGKTGAFEFVIDDGMEFVLCH